MRASDLRTTRPPALLFCLAVAAMPLISSCADDPAAAQDLCAQYDDLVAAVEDVRALTPAGAGIEELRDAAATLRAELDQFQFVSEDRHDTAIANLRAAITGFDEAAVDADSEEALDLAAPLLEDSLDEVREAFAALNQSLTTQCALD